MGASPLRAYPPHRHAPVSERDQIDLALAAGTPPPSGPRRPPPPIGPSELFMIRVSAGYPRLSALAWLAVWTWVLVHFRGFGDLPMPWGMLVSLVGLFGPLAVIASDQARLARQPPYRLLSAQEVVEEFGLKSQPIRIRRMGHLW